MSKQDNVEIAEQEDWLSKVCVIGELCTGKTSLIHRAVSNVFSSRYRETIGANFALKVFINKPSENINTRMQIWDIGGSERFKAGMLQTYFKETDAFIVVYDLTRPGTFEAITRWLSEINNFKEKFPIDSERRKAPIFIVGNKTDMCPNFNQEAELDKLQQLADKNKESNIVIVDQPFLSAKESQNVQELFETVADSCNEIYHTDDNEHAGNYSPRLSAPATNEGTSLLDNENTGCRCNIL